MLVIPTQEDVVLEFQNTWVETWGMAITVITLLSLAGWGSGAGSAASKPRREPRPRPSARSSRHMLKRIRPGPAGCGVPA